MAWVAQLRQSYRGPRYFPVREIRYSCVVAAMLVSLVNSMSKVSAPKLTLTCLLERRRRRAVGLPGLITISVVAVSVFMVFGSGLLFLLPCRSVVHLLLVGARPAFLVRCLAHCAFSLMCLPRCWLARSGRSSRGAVVPAIDKGRDPSTHWNGEFFASHRHS